jgi:hypothetical protein
MFTANTLEYRAGIAAETGDLSAWERAPAPTSRILVIHHARGRTSFQPGEFPSRRQENYNGRRQGCMQD